MTSCSTAILAGKSIQQILHLAYRQGGFHNAFAGNFSEQKVALIENKAWNFTKYKPLNLSIDFKIDFLFSG